ncbi:MAG: cobyrinate a,c-diamide synthase [Desulfovibrionales bacterium]
MKSHPRLILAGLSGGSGKTIVSLGLCSFFRNRGYAVQPFKKGPDYIDAAWLSLAAGRSASNLDPFLMPAASVEALFWERNAGSDLAIIEGSRGLFDGKDVGGSCSTAELSRLLQTPVILIINSTKMTRTVAALVQGCRRLEPELHIAGVIFNQTAGNRHRAILTRSVEQYTDVPVLGALPRLEKNPIPERHMGLVSDQEFGTRDIFETMARTVNDWLDMDRILTIAQEAPKVSVSASVRWPSSQGDAPVRIGIVRDAALWFYYEENIEALRRAGAEVVVVSLLDDRKWPELHGLYLGGGFPETHASTISANTGVLRRIKELAEQGLPVYAECGGLMCLGQSIICNGVEFPMSGVFPFKTDLRKRPQALGYTRARTCQDNPFHPVGSIISGHEFHYSCFLPQSGTLDYALKMVRGKGIDHGCDGLVSRNVFATYTHIHALGVSGWAERFVATAVGYAREQFKPTP